MAAVSRPKPGDRFISRTFLKADARPPYTEDSYAEQVVSATRRWGPGDGDITVFYCSAALWDAGSRKGR